MAGVSVSEPEGLKESSLGQSEATPQELALQTAKPCKGGIAFSLWGNGALAYCAIPGLHFAGSFTQGDA
jgi:hypothetical protein